MKLRYASDLKYCFSEGPEPGIHSDPGVWVHQLNLQHTRFMQSAIFIGWHRTAGTPNQCKKDLLPCLLAILARLGLCFLRPKKGKGFP